MIPALRKQKQGDLSNLEVSLIYIANSWTAKIKQRDSGGLNRRGPHRLICLNAWLIGSGPIRRCGLVGVDVAFLEAECHCRVSHRVRL